ncbi:potassium channel family protein [Metapseudomonas furukawaii]|uniref:Trk system potassium uptake protein TrkA n=1 Tax=Metapseudomonas furukawaii TaxID=1149133 RepID=A0AAD1FFI0_METFU|nr:MULTISPECIES: TrkA family potassium uptake protein [Pseudomonas]ELS27869.1 Trk system potassium uptake protein TrkA [Pseudomonas furukawaii]OWJ95183.1 potassium transporter [Pseudomonas sp. A46]WAG81354.1 TrkA family potassium uptake protein [Pseudomonas furukawaii]BAU74157.1 Trk system potassium uptake protein TrkA [Pseudomonas furukawaii]
MLAKLLFSEQFAFSKGDSVVVIGLGRFGSSVAQSLMRLGHDVMGIDKDAESVHAWADLLTHAVQADSTNTMVLRQLGVADFAHAIVGIGTDLAASLMTIMALTELGIKDIWVKALTTEHGHIAQRIGAHHVVHPEADMGERVAHLISGRMVDFIEFDDGFGIAKIHAPTATHNHTLAESNVRGEFGVTVVGLKRANEDFQHAKPETLVLPGDLLIVSGSTHRIQKFAGRK